MIHRRTKPKEREASSPRESLVWVVDDTGKGTWLPADPNDPFENPFSTFTEWDSEEDEKGYANL